jgi:hypothetical protein
MWEAVWGGCQIQPCHNDIILTPQVTQSPKLWAKYGGYNCVRLLLYDNGQHITRLKHFVYVLYGCWKQFEVAVRFNHDIMTSFCWLHKWPRTPKSYPITVGITVLGCYSMTMDSISMCSIIFVHAKYGCGKQFEVAGSLNHDIMTSFWLHKWPRTPKSDPNTVGISV